jgi:hypothetical protein
MNILNPDCPLSRFGQQPADPFRSVTASQVTMPQA